MKIKVTVPKVKGGKFQIQLDHGILQRKDGVGAYGLVERRLLRQGKRKLGTAKKEKINVSVEYGQGDNAGEYETMQGALYSLACWLEDFLPLDYQREKYKKYNPDY